MILRALAIATVTIIATVATSGALGEPADIVETRGEVTINWSRGLLIARAAASADLRAPTAAIARVKAERTAGELALSRLLAVAKALPIAGSTVARESGEAAARWSALSGDAIVLEIEYTSDGSAIVLRGLPLEAVRRGAVGASPPPTDASGPVTLIVDAQAIAVTPGLGRVLVAGGERYQAPILYVRATPKGLASEGVTVKAENVTDSEIALPGAASALLARARDAGADVFVLTKEKR